MQLAMKCTGHTEMPCKPNGPLLSVLSKRLSYFSGLPIMPSDVSTGMAESLVSTLYNIALCKIKIIDEISSCIDFTAKIV